MALRILSGILRPNPPHQREGRAVIFFNPHRAERDAFLTERAEVGAGGHFIALPAKVIAIRDFVIQDKDTFWGRSESDWFRIDVEAWNTDLLEISWSCEPGAAIRGISYMISGEVAEIDPMEIASREVVLAGGGIPQMEIKVLADAHEAAANELVAYLNKLTSEEFRIVDDPSSAAIYLGDPTLAGISPADLGPDDFVVAARASPLLPGANDLVIAGGSELAAFYGVTAVLERLGFGWYFPNEARYDEFSSTEPGLGEKWPEPSDLLVLTPPLPRSGLIHRPSFRIRGIRERGAGPEREKMRKWARRNFQNVE